MIDTTMNIMFKDDCDRFIAGLEEDFEYQKNRDFFKATQALRIEMNIVGKLMGERLARAVITLHKSTYWTTEQQGEVLKQMADDYFAFLGQIRTMYSAWLNEMVAKEWKAKS